MSSERDCALDAITVGEAVHLFTRALTRPQHLLSRSSVNNDFLHGHHNSRCQLPIVASASFVALCIYGLHATTRGADGLNGMGFGQRTAKERLRTRTKVGFCPLIDQLHSHPVPYLKRLLATALDSVPPSAVPPWQHPPLQPVSKSPFSTRTGEYG